MAASNVARRPRLVVGLTGFFGSGKSSVARLWKTQGAKVIDCDALVREIYSGKPRFVTQIKKALGLEALERSQVARLVFHDARKRKRLEFLIHPYVFRRIAQILRTFKQGVVVIEMPLLFETGFGRQVDVIAVVTAEKRKVLDRLERKGFSTREARMRWRAQWPIEEKVRRADFAIDNSGSPRELKKQALEVWGVLKKMA